MSNFKFIVVLFLTIIFSTTSRGFQKERLDSLEQVFQNQSLSDSLRFLAIQQLTFSMIFSEGEKAKLKIQEVLKTAEKEVGKTRIYYEILQNLGIYYDVNQQTDSSLIIFSEILGESQRQGWKVLEQRAFNNLGMNRLNSSDYRAAIDYFSKSLEISRNDPNAQEANFVHSISNLGLANQELELYDQAIKYHLEALEIRERLNDPNGIAISSANLGICYRLMGEETRAEQYYQQAIENAKIAGNKVLFHRVHDNLGALYIGQKNYEKGLLMLNIALDSSDGFTPDPKMELSIVSNASAAFIEIGQTEKALEFANRGLRVLEENPELINYALTLKNTLAKIYFRKGDFEKGNAFLEEYQELNKKVFSEETARLLTDLQVKYDLEKKENQIALQTAELQEKNATLQRNYFAFAALGLLILLIVGTFVFYQNRNKRKQELLVKDRELKVKEAYIQASLESQEQERRRMAQDLHDGFGQYISALRMYVSQLKSDQAKEELKTELVNRTDSVLDEMSREISNVVYDLMPATLIRFGLIAALEDLAHRINAGQKVNLQIDAKNLPERLDELTEINLFRICQEWINNVLKYAQAKHIMLTVLQDDGQAQLQIKDDGNGFDVRVFQHSKRNGWKNITTRTELLNGKLRLFTQEGQQGTELLVNFPFVHRAN
ncbi:tetratricopeptide repeat protein [Algoriphagus sp. CAU 1675]|uniref:tetratricopeptide repeat-containing sensor histidine kinase n=1 Tax=Algoriphagus sp. CAU 1675 TaxID=3032597 RepID=UPI0023DB387F|nr:tetratricopeptide repeat protein [Algoriphagus sp. CAU 1675]MDF2156457.1 tetratricopeptide repeat protein [Algoriphagus sp. CAU 1675]